MNTVFDVAVTGRVLPGKDREAVVAALANAFSMDPRKAEYLVAGNLVVVKRGLESAVAQRYCDMLRQAGVESELIPQSKAAIAAQSPTAAESMSAASSAAAPASTTAGEPPPTSASTEVAAAVRTQPLNVQGLNTLGFKFRIEGQPEYAFVTIDLPAGETLKVEASAMATMDTNVVMKTKLRGGLSRFVTGESIFINEFTAQGAPAKIGLAPPAPGDLRHVYLEKDTIFLQNSAFLAASMEVAVESKWQGLVKGFFSGENLFLIRCHGTGDVWFNSYGGIIEIDVAGDYVVDTGNIVAFTDRLSYEVTKLGGYKSLFFSGEGFVCRFKGHGKVWIQTRKAQAFARWAWPFRPAKG